MSFNLRENIKLRAPREQEKTAYGEQHIIYETVNARAALLSVRVERDVIGDDDGGLEAANRYRVLVMRAKHSLGAVDAGWRVRVRGIEYEITGVTPIDSATPGLLIRAVARASDLAVADAHRPRAFSRAFSLEFG